MAGILFHMLNIMSQNTETDLVELGILPKQVSEYTNADIGSIILIPYTDSSGKILLNNGCIEFEVVGVNHHKDINDESKPTITLISKNIIRYAAFDAKEPNNPDSERAEYGNNRWSVSNIRQWLNSSKAANKWFTPQHEYDAPPDTANVDGNEAGAYADDPGFLAGFNIDVLQHFTNITNITAVPIVDGGDLETTIDKVFLASYAEILGIGNGNFTEGTFLSIKYPDEESRIKNGADGCYWMRSSELDFSCLGSVINEYGHRSGTEVSYGTYGIAPLIVLH